MTEFSQKVKHRLGAHLAGITLALLEYTRVVVRGHIPLATHHVIDVLAESRRVGSVLACAEAELIGSHEVL